MPDLRLSVVIVSWNHRHHLESCLAALFAQQFSGLEVVLVDNASQDGTLAWLAENYPAVRLIAFEDNRGFAAAINAGIKAAAAPYILSLNPDVTPQLGFLVALLQEMETDECIGIVAPKLLQASQPDLLDSTGLFIDRRRRPYDRGQGTPDDGCFDSLREVFGACGAAALYRRSMLEDVASGGQFFDGDFFAYYEDADLAWRAQLRGWRGVYAPQAVALHVRGFGDTLRKRRVMNPAGPRLAFCNRYLMTIKNDDLASFLVDLPLILLAELPRLLYTAFVSPTSLLGILDLVKAYPQAFRKRREIAARREVDPRQVRRWFLAAPHLP
jgi:GT2 family glycosyltransferase